MNLAGFRKRFRKRTDDLVKPYFWTDEEIDAMFNEAVAEACVRARLIYDEIKITIAYGRAVYQMDPAVYEVIGGWLSSNVPSDAINGRILTLTSQKALDEQAGQGHRRSIRNSAYAAFYQSMPYWAGTNWRNWKGDPLYAIQDQARIQLVPVPTVTSGSRTLTLNLEVYRVPYCTEQMKQPDSCPVIPQLWHERLIDWPLYRAFADKDTDTFDEQRSDKALLSFEASFGKRPDANVIRKQGERTRRTTMSNWP